MEQKAMVFEKGNDLFSKISWCVKALDGSDDYINSVFQYLYAKNNRIYASDRARLHSCLLAIPDGLYQVVANTRKITLVPFTSDYLTVDYPGVEDISQDFFTKAKDLKEISIPYWRDLEIAYALAIRELNENCYINFAHFKDLLGLKQMGSMKVLPEGPIIYFTEESSKDQFGFDCFGFLMPTKIMPNKI